MSSAQIEAAVRAAVLRHGRGRGEGGGGVPSLRVLVGLLGAAMLLATILTLIYKVATHIRAVNQISRNFPHMQRKSLNRILFCFYGFGRFRFTRSKLIVIVHTQNIRLRTRVNVIKRGL